MTTAEWLKISTDKLESVSITTARLDCLVLLEDVTGKDRSWLLAHPEYSLQGQPLEKLNQQIKRRMQHEPLAYIRGKTEFYGREFIVSPDTLQPRPESEAMIDLLKKITNMAEKLTIVDVGTGSGALAITAKLELPNIKVIATEISDKALEIAKNNSIKHKTKIAFYRGDLLEPIPKTIKPNVVIANLPYVPDTHTINQAAMQEPKIAIFGGPDGLDLYRQLFLQIATRQTAGQFDRVDYVITESLPPQHKKLTEIAKKHGYNLNKTDDFVQLFKSTH